MIPQVARTLIEEYRPEGRCRLLFDPYMGSGTSLVEAALGGLDAVGTDLNPLARLISRVKTTRYAPEVVRQEFEAISEALARYAPERVANRDFTRITNASYWYSEENLLRLSYLSQQIEKRSPATKDFFNVVLSEIVRETSYTRNGEFKRYRMSEEKIGNYRPDVFGLFREKTGRNLCGLEQFHAETTADLSVRICDFDSVTHIPQDAVAPRSVDMVVTSPPYGDSRTTVAYGQFSRWANEWFSFEHAASLDSLLMGGRKCREERFRTESIREELDRIKTADLRRYFEVVSFLNDYHASIGRVARTLRKGGRACYVLGNRNVKGVQIPLDYFTAEAFGRFGFVHDATVVREIPSKRMPSRTSPSNRRGEQIETMNREYIVVLHKAVE